MERRGVWRKCRYGAVSATGPGGWRRRGRTAWSVLTTPAIPPWSGLTTPTISAMVRADQIALLGASGRPVPAPESRRSSSSRGTRLGRRSAQQSPHDAPLADNSSRQLAPRLAAAVRSPTDNSQLARLVVPRLESDHPAGDPGVRRGQGTAQTGLFRKRTKLRPLGSCWPAGSPIEPSTRRAGRSRLSPTWPADHCFGASHERRRPICAPRPLTSACCALRNKPVCATP
jgi:hypothetical protein